MSMAEKDNAMAEIPLREFGDGKICRRKNKSNILLQLSFNAPPESVMERVQNT